MKFKINMISKDFKIQHGFISLIRDEIRQLERIILFFMGKTVLGNDILET